ncbi:MAG: hypothetical protein H0W89_05910 [Candidatus Levybacteria bacterium]|nr:hypothetical protein [Candidatus Levybacteria bacterium]
MQRKVTLLLFMALFLVTASPLHAEEITGTPSRDEIRAERENIKKEVKEKREETKKEIKQFKSENRQEVEKMRDEMKATRQADKEAFKAQLSALKDERKKTTAERIDTKLVSINDKRTESMADSLTRLKEILNRLINKTNEAKAAGADTTATETAINNAKTSITAAETAIATQKNKTYTATVGDEASLGKSFSATYKLLKADLGKTKETLKASKDAVKNVATALKAVETPEQ